jgi:hypothetical protein
MHSTCLQINGFARVWRQMVSQRYLLPNLRCSSYDFIGSNCERRAPCSCRIENPIGSDLGPECDSPCATVYLRYFEPLSLHAECCQMRH